MTLRWNDQTFQKQLMFIMRSQMMLSFEHKYVLRFNPTKQQNKKSLHYAELIKKIIAVTT